MRRLFTLISKCLEHEEPVLLVGGTGVGKTTISQVIAMLKGQRLRIINCHQHTETADFLGGLRPTRNKAGTASRLRELLNSVLGNKSSCSSDLKSIYTEYVSL